MGLSKGQVTRAIRYNSKAARDLGWGSNYRRIPHVGALRVLPRILRNDLSIHSEAYWLVMGVYEYQQQHPGLEEDGLLGPLTWSKILEEAGLKAFDAGACNRGIKIDDDYHAFPGVEERSIADNGMLGGRRTEAVKSIVLHWGGRDLIGLGSYLQRTRRQVSSHFGVGVTAQGVATHQYLDTEIVAWHAGRINRCSVGVDIAQSPLLQNEEYYTEHLYAVEQMDNLTGRGRRRCLSLDHRIAQQTTQLVQRLCEIYQIPWDYPRHHDVIPLKQALAFHGVLGHHHLSGAKWDIAPWWAAVMEEGQGCK